MRRPIVLIALACAMAVVARADVVAAGVVAAGGAGVWLLLRRRRPNTVYASLATTLVGVTAVAALAAIAVPTFHQRRDPLLVPADLTNVRTDLRTRPGTFELNGYVVSDNDNAAAGVDALSPSLAPSSPRVVW